MGFFVKDGGRVWVNDTNGDLGGEGLGEMEGDFIGEGGVAGSSLTQVRLTSGESSITLGSCKLVLESFGMLNQTFFIFLLDEVVASIASLNASKISCHACFMAASLFSPDVRRSDLFIFFALVCMGYAPNQI